MFRAREAAQGEPQSSLGKQHPPWHVPSQRCARVLRESGEEAPAPACGEQDRLSRGRMRGRTGSRLEVSKGGRAYPKKREQCRWKARVRQQYDGPLGGHRKLRGQSWNKEGRPKLTQIRASAQCKEAPHSQEQAILIFWIEGTTGKIFLTWRQNPFLYETKLLG